MALKQYNIYNDNIIFSMVDFTQLCRQKHDINTSTHLFFVQVHIFIYFTTLEKV